MADEKDDTAVLPAPGTPPATPAAPKKEKHPDAGFLGGLLEKIGLRGVMYHLGGRKTVLGGGALGIIALIINTSMSDTAKAICCASVAVVAVGTVIAHAIEDRAKK